MAEPIDLAANAHPSRSGATDDKRADWLRHAERSNMFWLRVMTWISLRLGRPIGRLVLILIALYFLVLGPRARRASKDYLRRVLPSTPTWRNCFAHFFAFASTIHDRVYLINDRHDLFDVRVIGEKVIRDAMSDGRGVLLIGAHMGSFEVLRAVGHQHGCARVALVMYEENARKINQALAAINPASQADIIALGHVDSMLAVRDRLAEGVIVGMLGDRTPGKEPTRSVRFLGDDAEFPTGPLRMGAMLRCPVLFMCGLYLGGNRYDVHFEPLADFSTVTAASRNALVAEALETYVARLEYHCRNAPYNWFNFHEFWSRKDVSDAKETG